MLICVDDPEFECCTCEKVQMIQKEFGKLIEEIKDEFGSEEFLAHQMAQALNKAFALGQQSAISALSNLDAAMGGVSLAAHIR